ncbi:sigma-70 family RNA polymerase sigma factor [bacterium]|nr:sigma-70 family RNA polymerase sigma factor [Planctomycetaceae bacterium]MDB4494283.1 sigma-70 family RNA polymerase sigma factor [Pseudomonadales bacterium]MDB4639266.1 sigma-70 family RNA polymerase sigma factor [bacterium]MDC0317001.1 sigma-70 family RNA polymerase sigma factor [bacterium]
MTTDNQWSAQPASQQAFSTRSSFIVNLKEFSPQNWNNFVLAYTPMIRFWIRRKNVPSSFEDDVLQDTFRSICISIGRFDLNESKGSFRGWLRTIAERRVADCLRNLPPEQDLPPHDLESLPSPTERSDQEIAAEQAANEEVKARALELVRQSTTDRTWQMFWHSTIDGIPTSQIAEQFGVSNAAVRVAKQRVTKRLKDLMIGDTESTD